MFIDEVLPAPGAAGELIFSHQEDEPLWNLLFVSNLAAALEHEAEIAHLFMVRDRDVVWSLPQSLPQPGGAWREILRAVWMAQRLEPLPPLELRHTSISRVHSASEIASFNRLYAAVFWHDPLAEEIALPITNEYQVTQHSDDWEVSHWLLHEGGEAVAIASLVRRNNVCGLYNVGTAPAHTRRGHASRLVTQLTRLMAAQGCSTMFLLTEDATLPPFYERLGFETIETSLFYRHTGAGLR